MGMWVPALVSFGVSAVTSIASYFLSTKETEGPRLSSLDTPNSSYGQPIPTVYGKTKVAGNLMWTRKLREVRKDGNKIKGQPSEYKYYATFAVLLCKGEVDVSKIWFNGKLVYDFYSPSGESQIASSKLSPYMKIYRGTADQQPDPTIQSIEGADRTPAFKGKCYLVFNDLPLKELNNGIPAINCEVIQSENPLLSDIITNICNEAGISNDRIDVTELRERVSGLIIENNGGSYRDVLEQLAKIYLFYVTEDRTGKLLFRKIQRPVTSCFVPLGELATRDFGNEKSDNYKRIRLQDAELPSSLSVNFRNPNLRYNNDTQIVLTRKSDDYNNVSVDCNLSLYRTEARFVGLILLAQFWTRRNRYEEINLSPKWINAILPGDVITIPLNDSTNATVQVESVSLGANYQLNLKCVDYEGSSFTPPPIDVDEEIKYDFISDPSSYGDADLFLLDIPIFDNRSKSSGVYAVASSVVQSWKNGSLLSSFDYGNSYQNYDTIYKPSAIGICAEALPVKRNDVIDYSSELTVTIENANPEYQLFSSTDIAFLNGEVLALIGKEIVAFKNAVLISLNTYKINTFLRGLFNTPISGHASNEQFILLKGNTAATNVFFPIEVGQSAKFKLQTLGANLETVPVVDFLYEGNLHNPYEPFNITGIQNGLILRIAWFRRSNYQNETGYNFDISLYNLSGGLQKELVTIETYFDIAYEDLIILFPNDSNFIVKIRERNPVKTSNWVEQSIPIISPYLVDENGDYISDEESNFILY